MGINLNHTGDSVGVSTTLKTSSTATREIIFPDKSITVAGLSDIAGRNRIINGSFDVWQRGESITPPLGSLTSYVSDRWYSYQTGAATAIFKSSGDGAKHPFCAAWNGVTSNTEVTLLQNIESANSANFRGSNAITLSIRLFSNVAKDFTINIDTANTDNVFSAVTNRTSTVFSHAGNGWYTATLTYSNPHADIKNGARIRVSVTNCTTGVFGVTGVQLENGSVATEFEQRNIGEIESLCKRYFRKEAFYIPAATSRSSNLIGMRVIPAISGGGVGFSSTETTKDTLIAYQTTGVVVTLSLDAEMS